jgi:hypothetical protein
MTAGTGRALLTRAEDMADTTDLAGQLTEIIGRARAARVDQDALAGLVAAVRILGGDVTALFRAARGRHPDGPYQHDTGLLDAVEEISIDLAAAATAAARLQDQARQELQQARDDEAAASRALAAARALAVAEPCQGCHAARASAIEAAQRDLSAAREQARYAGAALEVLAGLKLRQALRAVRRVPEDLHETYAAAYDLVTRDPRAMPEDGDFITGQETPAAMAAAMLAARARPPRPGEHPAQAGAARKETEVMRDDRNRFESVLPDGRTAVVTRRPDGEWDWAIRGVMCPPINPDSRKHKENALQTLTRGDRVCWPAGAGRSAYGTVTAVDGIDWHPGVNGPVFRGIAVTLRVPHCPAWDSHGWPVDEPATVHKSFRFSSDVEHAYTPPVPDAPRPVTLLLACRHRKDVISDASTGELLADDAACPQCGTAQWVTGTRE